MWLSGMKEARVRTIWKTRSHNSELKQSPALGSFFQSSALGNRDPENSVLRTPLLSLEMDKKQLESAFAVPDGKTLADLEREILSQLLSRYDGNRTLTAEKLGISRRTIQRKIKEHNLPF